VEPQGPKLAEGRDSEIFEHGPGLVLRRSRDGRSLVREAEVMRYVADAGYPVPRVHDAGVGYLVMDRVDGPTLLDTAIRHPLRLGSYGRLLADLHQRLHAIPAPAGLPEAGVPGDRVLHRDLHPLNVLVTGDGPVVIDWANVAAGDPAYDVADTWVVFAAAEVPGSRFDRALAAVGRGIFLRSFLRATDKEAARAAIPAAVENRLHDRNMSEGEKARMRRLAEKAAAATGRSSG
jgi:aminoglycoside phosphotransferase (APT) family kinase protein